MTSPREMMLNKRYQSNILHDLHGNARSGPSGQRKSQRICRIQLYSTWFVYYELELYVGNRMHGRMRQGAGGDGYLLETPRFNRVNTTISGDWRSRIGR